MKSITRAEFKPTAGGELHLTEHPTKEFVEYSLAAAGVKPGELAGLTVVVDAFHGSAGPEIWHALRVGGADSGRAARVVPNGQFPTGSPSPTSQGKMHRAISSWRARKGRRGARHRRRRRPDRLRRPPRHLERGFVTLPIIREAARGRGTKNRRQSALRPEGQSTRTRRMGQAGRRACAVSQRPLADQGLHDANRRRSRRRRSGHYYHRLEYEGLTIAAENSIVTILLFLKAVKASPDLMDHLWKLQRQVFTTGEFNYQFADDATRDRAVVLRLLPHRHERKGGRPLVSFHR